MSCRKPSGQYLPRTQRGIALITVLIVVALVTIIATQITSSLLVIERRQTNVLHGEQAWLYALGAESLAAARLQDATKDDDKRIHLGQEWARGSFQFPVDGGLIKGTFSDASTCLNINALLKKNKKQDGTPPPNPETPPAAESEADVGQNLLARLFEQLVPDAEVPPQALAAALMDWLDDDADPRGADGAEDYFYQGLTPAYRAGNGPLGAISELRLVKGFTAEVYAKVKPFLCALPDHEYVKLNVNTLHPARAELLMVMVENLPLESAREVLKRRPKDGYTLQDFWTAPGMPPEAKAHAQLKDRIAVDSDYFRLRASAVVGRGEARVESLLQRQDDRSYVVVSRSYSEE